VDAEGWLPHGEWEPLRVSALTLRENEALSSLPSNEQRAVFFRLWTRKEALLKALGTGLSIEPSRLDLGLPSQLTEVISIRLPGQSTSNDWWFSQINFEPEMSVAVTVPGRTGKILLNPLL
jgi:4'-phosphopantetheinyl transferase